MKRSRSAALTLMASSAVMLTACDNSKPDPAVPVELYSSVEACTAAGEFTAQQCQDAYDAALKEHMASAPRFDSQALCENTFGANGCQIQHTNSGGSFWAPFLAGYVVSSIVDKLTQGPVQSRYYGAPVYSGYSGSFNSSRHYFTALGKELSRARQGLTLPRSSVVSKPPPAFVQHRTSVVSRGGFGGHSSFSGRGGWSG